MQSIMRWTGASLSMIVLLLVIVSEMHAQPESIVLNAVILDFKDSHVDFEGDERTTGVVIPDIVRPFLGLDKLPVYNDTTDHHTVNGKASFDQWFRYTQGINVIDRYRMVFEKTGELTYRFSKPEFFPIDNQLFGNEGRDHNFHFTLQVHGAFTYRGDGGEYIELTSDDDGYLFINNILAIDIGGRHRPLTRRIDLDKNMADVLGLIPGLQYDFALFFAERHTHGSHLDIETTITLEPDGCLLITPEGERLISCVGTPGDDTIIGTDRGDVIFGLSGRDILLGGDGDDVIFGGPGPDDIRGGRGSDVLFGENGNDRVASSSIPTPQQRRQKAPPDIPLPCTHQEDDKFLDTLRGGPGSDVLCGDDSIDHMYGDEGADTLRAEGGSDELYGGPGNDVLDAGCGNLELDVDLLNGEEGEMNICLHKYFDRLENCQNPQEICID